MPRQMTAMIGAKKPFAWPTTDVTIHHATPAATAHCAIMKPLARMRAIRALSETRDRRIARSKRSCAGLSPIVTEFTSPIVAPGSPARLPGGLTRLILMSRYHDRACHTVTTPDNRHRTTNSWETTATHVLDPANDQVCPPLERVRGAGMRPS